MKEEAKHKKAFEAYYASGESRSLVRLAKRLGVAKNTVKNWSVAFNWTERIEQRDREVARVVQSRTIKAEVEAGVRNKQIVQLALVTLARQIAEGKVRGTLSDLDKLVRLEAFLEGKAESRHEVVARDLRSKSLSELRVLLREEVESLGALAEQAEDAVVDAVVEDGPPAEETGPALDQGKGDA